MYLLCVYISLLLLSLISKLVSNLPFLQLPSKASITPFFFLHLSICFLFFVVVVVIFNQLHLSFIDAVIWISKISLIVAVVDVVVIITDITFVVVVVVIAIIISGGILQAIYLIVYRCCCYCCCHLSRNVYVKITFKENLQILFFDILRLKKKKHCFFFPFTFIAFRETAKKI